MGRPERRGKDSCPLTESPPRLAVILLRTRLPRELAEAITGDLEEEYRARVLPAYGPFRAALWFWGQALTVRGSALRRATRGLRSTRPTWERNRPSRVGAGDPNPWNWLQMLFQDFTYAVRRLARSPGFTVTAVLSLALGIGANSAMFSLVNSVLLRGLPAEDPEALVEIYTSDSSGYPYGTSSYLDYADLRERSDVFDGVVGSRNFAAPLDQGGDPNVVFGDLISWDYFQVVGVPMALGRSFLPEEGATQGSHAVMILGYRTWTQEFGAREDVVGETVRLNGQPFTVVGVAPKAFTGSLPVLVTSVYVPLMMTNQAMSGSRSMLLKGRLRDGVTPDQADGVLGTFSAALAESNENRLMTLVPTNEVSLHPLVDGALLPVAGLLLSVVGLVLLIACANLASFPLARAEDRHQEIAVRLALGARRTQLVRQLMVETTLLAALGGLGGFLLADWTVGVLMNFQPPLPIPRHQPRRGAYAQERGRRGSQAPAIQPA